MSDGSGGGATSPRSDRQAWKEEHTVALLRAAAEFRARTGSAPTGATIPAFCASLPPSLSSLLSQQKIHNKLRHLRHNFNRGVGPASVHQLSQDIWLRPYRKKPATAAAAAATKPEPDADNGGEADHRRRVALDLTAYPAVMGAVAEYSRMNTVSNSLMEARLKLADASRMAALEQRWRSHWLADAKLESKQHDLKHKLLDMLMA